jgi:hypothetical protein
LEPVLESRLGATPTIFVPGGKAILNGAVTSIDKAEIITSPRHKGSAPPNKLAGLIVLIAVRSRVATGPDIYECVSILGGPGRYLLGAIEKELDRMGWVS